MGCGMGVGKDISVKSAAWASEGRREGQNVPSLWQYQIYEWFNKNNILTDSEPQKINWQIFNKITANVKFTNPFSALVFEKRSILFNKLLTWWWWLIARVTCQYLVNTHSFLGAILLMNMRWWLSKFEWLYPLGRNNVIWIPGYAVPNFLKLL